MNIRETLNAAHSKETTSDIVRYIGNDKKRFAELMQLFFEGDYQLSQRAAWPMSYVVSEHPGLATPYIKRWVDCLTQANWHPAIRRNILRAFAAIPIPVKWQGKLMHLCFEFIANPHEAAAVKAFSLAILENMVGQYPEILPEIKVIIEARWESETPAFRSRARKILKAK